MGGGMLSQFVIWVSEFGYDAFDGNPHFRLETVIFGGILGSLYAVSTVFLCSDMGWISDRFGSKTSLIDSRSPALRLGYFLWIMAGDFWLLLFSRIVGGMAGGNISVATAAIADVTRGKKIQRDGFCRHCLWSWVCVRTRIGGFASQWDWSSSNLGFFGMHPFSAAATISFVLP